MSKTVKVDKDYVERVIKEDLKRKYPDVTELEFTGALHAKGIWLAEGTFSTSRGFTKAFMYFIDEETGEIMGYVIK
jgi:hypothetical protein